MLSFLARVVENLAPVGSELAVNKHTNMCRWPLLLLVAVLVNNAAGSGVASVLKLNNGYDIPVLGLGTWLGFTNTGGRVIPQENEVKTAVEWAIDAGYRHIDTASIYGTEKQVGEGIKKKLEEGVIKREELFVTTKLWNEKHAKDEVLPALRESLSQLGLDYLDLYLIHWPVSIYANRTASDVDFLGAWEGLIEAQKLGLVRSIGLSNFNQQQIDRLIAATSVVPQSLQVELNLNLQQPELLAYCRNKNIAVTAYTPFGSLFYSKAKADAPPPRIDTPELVAIAAKYNKTVPQINLRYLVEIGVIPIPKSVTKTRVEQNIDVFDFQLTEEEKKLLKSYDRHYRTIAAKQWLDSPYYPFEKA